MSYTRQHTQIRELHTSTHTQIHVTRAHTDNRHLPTCDIIRQLLKRLVQEEHDGVQAAVCEHGLNLIG